MTLSKSARYALCAAVEMALAGDHPVTVGQVAAPHTIPPAALAKVFQQLVRAGLAVGTRGIGGGYRLARPPSEITVLDIVAVFETWRPPAHDPRHARDGEPPLPQAAALQRLFDEIDEGLRHTLASVTVETLVR
jgi:Rrf2 family protein